jgi:hypothetical protein
MFSPIAMWSFTEAPAPEPGLTYGRFVAVRRVTGTNQRAAWSNDGITWNIATTPNSYNFYSVDFSPEQGLYCAVSESAFNDNIMTSTNSVTWTARSKPDNSIISGIKWCPSFNKWICNSRPKIFVSDDAITWTIAHTFSANFNSYSYNNIYNETDGPIWACVVASTSATLRVLKLCYTTDGSTFTEINTTDEEIWPISDGKSIIYSTELDRYVIFNQGTPNRILTSTDITSGWSWYTQSVAPAGALRIGGDAGEGLFVSPMNGSTTTTPIQYSSLGTNGSWTASTLPSAAYNFYDAEYADEIDTWFITRTNAANGYSSTDGITWTSRTMPGNEFTNVTWGPGVRTTGYKEGSGIT